MDNDRNHLPLQAVDMGVKFNIEVAQSQLDPGIVTTIKKQGRLFLMKLLKELQKRLPSNVHLLRSMDALSPETVLGIRKPRLHELSFLPKFNGDIGKLDEQWQRLGTVSWPADVVIDVEKFWMEVHDHTDASGENDFIDVGKFALSMLAIPVSNASVERVFSQMNLVKSKIRNRMQQSTLENILHVRAFMQRNSACCHEFTPTQEMLSLFTQDIYNVGTNDENNGYIEIDE